ncbi:uncharacterized protein [Physcomitrium patens]|uniref:uncharacterized protein n=1 Tax=Physcomitrium patens TaxID=3218 RepID=UPI003CCD4DCF
MAVPVPFRFSDNPKSGSQWQQHTAVPGATWQAFRKPSEWAGQGTQSRAGAADQRSLGKRVNNHVGALTAAGAADAPISLPSSPLPPLSSAQLSSASCRTGAALAAFGSIQIPTSWVWHRLVGMCLPGSQRATEPGREGSTSEAAN